MLEQLKKYYLNNVSDKDLIITLSTNRVIKAQSSLSLNFKDVLIYKKLKEARRNKPSMLDNLKLSTIRIEDDTNYLNKKESIKDASLEDMTTETSKNEVVTDDKNETTINDKTEETANATDVLIVEEKDAVKEETATKVDEENKAKEALEAQATKQTNAFLDLFKNNK